MVAQEQLILEIPLLVPLLQIEEVAGMEDLLEELDLLALSRIHGNTGKLEALEHQMEIALHILSTPRLCMEIRKRAALEQDKELLLVHLVKQMEHYMLAGAAEEEVMLVELAGAEMEIAGLVAEQMVVPILEEVEVEQLHLQQPNTIKDIVEGLVLQLLDGNILRRGNIASPL